MTLSIGDASRTPFESLRVTGALIDAVVFMDDGAADVIRWLGGVPFIASLGGAAAVPLDAATAAADPAMLDLQPLRSEAPVRAVAFLVGSVWDAESALDRLVANVRYQLVTVCCARSEATYSYHPLAAALPPFSYAAYSAELTQRMRAAAAAAASADATLPSSGAASGSTGVTPQKKKWQATALARYFPLHVMPLLESGVGAG
jgi:hypothetical protein